MLRRGEDGEARVTSIAYGGGMVAVALYLAWGIPLLTGASTHQDYGRSLTPAAAEALFVLGYAGDGFLLALELAAAALALATAIVVLRTRVMPVWFGWLGLVYGLWLLVLPIGWIGMIGFPLWILLTTALVWAAESRSGRTGGTAV